MRSVNGELQEVSWPDALDAAADGDVGRHYGYGDGADAVLPAWTPP